MAAQSLRAYLTSRISASGNIPEAVAAVILAAARGALEIRKLIANGNLDGALGANRGVANADGDLQKELDVLADSIFLNCMKDAPLALYASEENASAIVLDPKQEIGIAIDPLDGSSNIDNNVSIGTIFSILPVAGNPAENPDETFLQPGTEQLAAGFFIYGPQLALVLTLGSGTRIFIHSAKYGDFIEAKDFVDIPKNTSEFAINASNYRHWEGPVRLYIDDCLAGSDGPRERDFNMRWIASLVADTYRILARGGVFLYPADQRRGYQSGRLRLTYEANPIAFIIEQAGGAATDSVNRILDLTPNGLHGRVPLVFGSEREVQRIARYHSDPAMISERSPLFGNRGLFRA